MTAVTRATHPTAGHRPPRSALRGRPTFHTQILAELSKLTTTRAPRWVALSAAALAALAISGVVASGGVAQEALGTDLRVRTVLAHGGLASILPLVLGILLSTSEYRHGTVVDTFLTEPRRGRVIGAKLVAGALAGLVIGVAVALTTAATVGIWFSAKDVPFDLSSSTVVRALVGIAIWDVLYATIGVAVGSIIRTPAAAIVSVLVWLTVAETAVAGLLVEVGRWLPGTAAQALGGAPTDGLLSQVGGGVVLLGWAVLAAAAAVVATRRRDVT